jgi:hypothetical protein
MAINTHTRAARALNINLEILNQPQQFDLRRDTFIFPIVHLSLQWLIEYDICL